MVSASARHSSFLEAYFGPPSDPIDISQFLDAHTELPTLEEVSAEEDFQVEDIKNPIKNIWDNPRLSAYLIQQHDLAMDAFYRSTKPGAKKRKVVNLTPPEDPCVELKDLKACLEGIGISSYKYPSEAAFFTRATKLSDQNALTKIKQSSPCESVEDPDKKALIIVSIYSKVHVGYGRASQHVFLSSQTLGDLLGAFACTSNDLPIESATPQGGVAFEHPQDASASTGAAIVVEGVLFGDGLGGTDYADKILSYLEKKNKVPNGLTKSSKLIHDVSLGSLSLRTQEPYWILHQGDCEHYAVIDQIRMRHSSDPTSGYPLTVQITPLPIDVCRGCTKVSAVWSIVGDERLGESPCLLCGPCWRNMGDPPPENDVIVVPLPRYQVGWT